MKRLIVLALALSYLALAGVACKNTAEGVGQDVERAGEKIQDKVD